MLFSVILLMILLEERKLFPGALFSITIYHNDGKIFSRKVGRPGLNRSILGFDKTTLMGLRGQELRPVEDLIC